MSSDQTARSSIRLPLRAFHRDPLSALSELVHEHGSRVQFRMGPWTFLLLNDPPSIRWVLTHHSRHFVKGPGLDGDNPLIGQGLLTREGRPWAEQRRRLAPVFKPRNVDHMSPFIAQVTDRFLTDLPIGRIDAEEAMLRLSLSAALATILASDNLDTSLAGHMGVEVRWLMRHFYHRTRSIWRFPYHIPGFNRRYHAHARALTEHIAQIQQAPRPYDTLWPVLSQTPMQRLQELSTMVIAGYETTGHALAWTLYLLARHPDLQEAVYQESLQSIEASADTHPQTFGAIQESLRLYPPVWLLSRRVIDAGTFEDVSLEPGMLVLISPWVLHHSAVWFDQPDDFWPARFQQKPPLPYTFIPFGGGSRGCIGEHLALKEALTALPRLMRRLCFTAIGNDSGRVFPGLTLGSDGPLWLSVSLRP